MGILRIIRQILLRGGQPRCFIRMLVELQFYTFHTDIPSCEAAPAQPPLHKFAETQSWDELFKPHCVVALGLKLKRFSMHVNEKGVCTNSSRNEKCNEKV